MIMQMTTCHFDSEIALEREKMMLKHFKAIPMNHIPQESAEQFDRLTKIGLKLNLIKGEYK